MQETLAGFRLSQQQARLWLLQQQNSHAYRSYCSLLITGHLQPATLEIALKTIFQHHEMYRTCFHRLPGIKMPVQVINADTLYTWHTHDLSSYQTEEQNELIATLLHQGQTYSIDLEHGPLFHCSLLSLTTCQHLLLIHFHALYVDIQTMQTLTRELAQAYHNSSSHDEQETEVAQYIQFSEWQNELLLEVESADTRDYWRSKKLTAFSTQKLPCENSAESGRLFTPDLLTIAVEPELYTQLTISTRQQGSSLSHFLLTCWHILLWQLTRNDESLIGLNIDGRIYDDLTDVAGLIARYLPLTLHINEQFHFVDLLTLIKTAHDELLTQQTYFAWEDLNTAETGSDTSLLYPFCFDYRAS